MRRRRAVRMGVAVMMGVVAGMGMRHGRTLYYNIAGVYVMPLPGLPVGAPPAGIALAYWLWELWPATAALSHPLTLDVRCVAGPARRLDSCQDNVSQRPAPQSN